MFSFCARNLVPKIARSTPVLGCKPSGGDKGSYSWAPGLDTLTEISERIAVIAVISGFDT